MTLIKAEEFISGSEDERRYLMDAPYTSEPRTAAISSRDRLWLVDVLIEVAEYLDKYADYEDAGHIGMVPNDAARLLLDVTEAIKIAEGSL